MRTWLVLGLALVLGSAVGLARTWSEFHVTANQFSVTQDGESAAADVRRVSVSKGPSGTPEKAPKAVVEGGAEHDFGVMSRYGKLQHAFIIRNDGDADLELEEGASSCKCTVLNLGEDSGEEGKIVVPPGEKAEIQLEWTARGDSPSFNQTAEILTNDPQNPSLRLKINGRVQETVSVKPTELRFVAISADSEKRLSFFVWSAQVDDLKIESTRLADDESARFLSVETETATPEQLAKLAEDAKSGYRITVTVKPGMPTGALKQAVMIKTNQPDIPSMIVPVEGSVISDVSVLGDRRYEAGPRLLDLGPVRQSEGAEAQLFVLIKGDEREEVKVTAKSIFPSDVLRVEMGEPKVGERTVTHPFKVIVPPGARAVTLLGRNSGDRGEIVLETTHPQQKEVKIQVRFSVNPE